MKGVDTPVLLALLEGRGEGTALLEEQGEEELCTTEVNLFELEAIARSGPKEGRSRRLAAVERIRHKLSVIPIDERATRAAALLASSQPVLPVSSPTYLLLGALHAAGAMELLTTDAAGLANAKLPLKVTIVRKKHSKSR